MHANIISGGSQQQRQDYITSLLTSPIDLQHLTPDKTSITIKQIHQLLSALHTSARLPRLVWIEEANLLTTPAQNSLLKLLEEPPSNTRFYLTCNSATSLLPTIRSRCSLIPLNTTDSTDPQIFTELKNYMNLPLGARLSQIPKLDRPAAQNWFLQLQIALRLKLRDSTLTTPQRHTLVTLAAIAQSASVQLKHNVGISLVYESFFLHLPKSK